MNGPRVVARGKDVAVAWYTEAGQVARVKLALSRDGGRAFGRPIQLAEGSPLGRVDVARFGDDGYVVCWLDVSAPGKAQVVVCRVTADGDVGAAERATGVPADRTSGFPRMASHDGGLLIAWTDPSGGYRIRTARVKE